MKRFPKVLRGLLTEREMTQNALSAMSGFDHVKISRLSNGVTRPDATDLAAILAAFSDPEDRFRLVLAHIQDEVPEDAFRLLEIHLGGDRLNELPPLIPEQIAPRLQRALRFLLHEMAEVPSIADVLIDFATAQGWQDAAPVKPRGKTKYPAHKTRASRGSEAGRLDTALEILKKGHPGDAPPKS